MLAPAERARALRLIGAAGLVGLFHWLNAATTPAFRLGILYIIPVLLVAWHDGLAWGIGFAAATALLRFVGFDTPLTVRLLNEVAYLAVVGIALAGLAQLRRTRDQLHLLATRDPLTDALNARAFSDELAQELARSRRYGRPVALIYLDLDDFKAVNDAHGHATGNAVLRLVADAMRSAVRRADTIGRLGGDEFALLMPETESEVARAAATRLRQSIRTAFSGTPSVTASIGVVSVSGSAQGTDELLRRADQAMYDAKRGGKDRVVELTL